jgi:alanine racemase
MIGRMSAMPDLTTYARIDLDALDHNVRALTTHIGPSVALIAVVKANAYGHGAIPVARAALSRGAARLAVARPDEGIQLRGAGITAPILVMGYSIPAEADAYARFDLTATINTLEGAQAISARAKALGVTATFHVKVDTGMGRYGLPPEEVIPFLNDACRLPNLRMEGIYTHFATSDERDKGFARQQMEQFEGILDAARRAGFEFSLRHAANSGAILDLPEAHFDGVRVGVALYGLYPSDEVSKNVALQPILSLHSRVGRIRALPAGAGVGYGRTWIASRPTTVALIPIGYGDGYRRSLSNRGVILIGGQRAPLIGRVSMDQIMADVTDIPGVAQDDPVVLIGAQGGEKLTADEVAALAGTINYEITTGLMPRLPRIYVSGGEVVDILRPLVPG